jgi:N-acetylglutamate synthase
MADIRPMRASDFAEVSGLWRRTEGLVISADETSDAIARYLDRNPGISHVAVVDDRIVGAALCGHDGRRAYLHHLAVDASFRGRGIGRGIVNAILAALREAGIVRCNLFVVDESEDARRFWTNDGWYEWPTIRLLSRDLADS